MVGNRVSGMGRVAEYVSGITDSDDEYNAVSKEVSQYWDVYNGLSPKAKATIATWEEMALEAELRGKSNHNEVQEWEGLYE